MNERSNERAIENKKNEYQIARAVAHWHLSPHSFAIRKYSEPSTLIGVYKLNCEKKWIILMLTLTSHFTRYKLLEQSKCYVRYTCFSCLRCQGPASLDWAQTPNCSDRQLISFLLRSTNAWKNVFRLGKKNIGRGWRGWLDCLGFATDRGRERGREWNKSTIYGKLLIYWLPRKIYRQCLLIVLLFGWKYGVVGIIVEGIGRSMSKSTVRDCLSHCEVCFFIFVFVFLWN